MSPTPDVEDHAADAMREMLFARSAEVVTPILESSRARGELGPVCRCIPGQSRYRWISCATRRSFAANSTRTTSTNSPTNASHRLTKHRVTKVSRPVRGIATRYDKYATTDLGGVLLAALVIPHRVRN